MQQLIKNPESAKHALLGQQTDQLRLISSTRIDHELDVFDARRGILQLATQAGFSNKQAYYLVTAMTELGNNIAVHSLGGRLALWAIYQQPFSDPFEPLIGLRVCAEDEGPGIVDIEQAMQEGFSTINSMGCGLSGASRLMDEMTISSTSEGTIVTATIWLNPTKEASDYV